MSFDGVRYVMVVSVVFSVSDLLWLFSDVFCVCQMCDSCVMCIVNVSVM